MEANTGLPSSSATHYVPTHGWQSSIPLKATMMDSTSNCPPMLDYPTTLVDAINPADVIFQVNQNAAILERPTPAGETVFIPIQEYLSRACASIYYREGSYNEYTLEEIYLAAMSTSGSPVAKQCVPYLLHRLQTQLTDSTFARCKQGQFTRLLISIHQPIKIRRQGAKIVSPEGPDNLEDAIFEQLIPYGPGSSMVICLPPLLVVSGTPEYLLQMFRSGDQM